MNAQTAAKLLEIGLEKPVWKFKTWTNGEIAICRYENGTYTGEWYGPYTADALAEIIQKSNAASEIFEALKDLRTRVVAEKVDCLNTARADAAIAKAEGSDQ